MNGKETTENRRSFEDNSKMDLKEMGLDDKYWIYTAHGRVQRGEFVNLVVEVHVRQMLGFQGLCPV
jgi:hypothetical protein